MEDPALDAADDLGPIVSWIEAETGLCFPDVHHETIRKTALRRGGALALESGAYLELLRCDDAEKSLFFGEIMIGETYFFRDERHFAVLISDILPRLMGDGRELRLWSATCATGEEAISLVAAAQHVRARLSGRLGAPAGFSVLASDINMNALAVLEAGRFPLSSLRSDGHTWHHLLELCGSMDGEGWQASPECLDRIRVRQLNILSEDPCEPESLDIAFFRNTLVYMPQEQKDRAVSRVARALRPGGYLFLSSTEIPSVRHPHFSIEEGEGCFYFRKLASSENRTARIGVRGDRAEPPKPAMERKRHERLAPASKRPAAPIGAAELEEGLALASDRLREPPSKAEAPGEGPVEQAAAKIEAIVAALHANSFSAADLLVGEFEALARENHVSLYLRALSLWHQGDQAGALELWERSRVYEPRFWPALFQAGKGYRQSNPGRSRALLRECLEAIDAGGEENRYLALLDGFGAPYYRRMAETMLARRRER